MLDSIAWRPRGRSLGRLVHALKEDRSQDALTEQQIVSKLMEREIILYPHEMEAPSQTLYERLTPEGVREVEQRLEPELAALYADGSEVEKKLLLLTFAAHYEMDSVLEWIGLSSKMPPEDIHAMGRGPLAAGGDPRLADLVEGHGAMASPGLVGIQTSLQRGGSRRIFPELSHFLLHRIHRFH